VPAKEKLGLQYLMGDIKTIDLGKLPKPKGPGVDWTVASALKILKEKPFNGRSLANGRKMFSAGLCVACHHFGKEGAGVGPDLTNLAKRADYKSMLESIIQPNLVVSDQFEQHLIKMKDGSSTMGRIVSQQNGILSILKSGFTPKQVTKIKMSDVASMKASKLSMMPDKMINGMNAEELKDLIAYFISQGNGRHAVYKGRVKQDLSVKKLNIKLISAHYGAAGNPKKQMNVLKIVQRQLDLRNYGFAMSNDLAGRDPAPGTRKVLILKYTLDGKAMTKTIPENGSVRWK